MLKKRKINVFVLMGGPSAEHAVSLATGKKIIGALNPSKFEVRPVLISRQGKWLLPQQAQKQLLLPPEAGSRFVSQRLRSRAAMVSDRGRTSEASRSKPPRWGDAAVSRNKAAAQHIAFIAMHGPYGEDGTVQGLLEIARIPYTGSGVLASALAMDKVKSAEIFKSHRILTPDYVAFNKREWSKKKNGLRNAIKKLGYPVVVKPQDQGSSVGITIVPSETKLTSAVSTAFKYSSRAMAQKYIRGKEVTCAVIDKGIVGTEMPLMPTEIIPKTSSFFDYHAKYTPGASEEITPPNLPKPLIKKIQKTALTCHRALGCSGMSRTDMIIAKSKIYVLEVNTIPGMTETSLLPQAAKACGIKFPELLERIIEAAINRFDAASMSA